MYIYINKYLKIDIYCKFKPPSSKLIVQFIVEVHSQYNLLRFPDISRRGFVFHLVNELYPKLYMEYHLLYIYIYIHTFMWNLMGYI